jgi:hypothetical protein
MGPPLGIGDRPQRLPARGSRDRYVCRHSSSEDDGDVFVGPTPTGEERVPLRVGGAPVVSFTEPSYVRSDPLIAQSRLSRPFSGASDGRAPNGQPEPFSRLKQMPDPGSGQG